MGGIKMPEELFVDYRKDEEFERLRTELAALKVAVIEARDSITCLCAEGPEFMKASEIRETIVKDITKLARLCGEE